jgi:aspartate kinase
MGLIVQKYGGTSVGTIDRIRQVADKIIAAKQLNQDLVIVLSAMSGQTDNLERLALELSATPDPREMDVLLSTGEQVTVALLAMTLIARGYAARSYLGWQLGIKTDHVNTKARIQAIDCKKIREGLTQGCIIIVAGFQGVDPLGNITTLGRGGSDTTAVGLAAALGAAECQIYTDVDGVYTTDPRIVPEARRMPRVTFEEMLELSSLGSKVLQIRAVEFAGKYNVPLRVLSTFIDGPGTLISYEEKGVEQPIVSGIAFNRDEAKLTLRGVPDVPGVASRIVGPISAAGIELDMIVQNIGDNQLTDFTFTVHRRDFSQAKALLELIAKDLEASAIVGDAKIVKVSLVGVGMRSHAGIASKMFKALGAEGINIQMISTSEIKVSVLMDEKYLELGVRALHAAFELDRDPTEEEK